VNTWIDDLGLAADNAGLAKTQFAPQSVLLVVAQGLAIEKGNEVGAE
jgi:hypothetical protein